MSRQLIVIFIVIFSVVTCVQAGAKKSFISKRYGKKIVYTLGPYKNNSFFRVNIENYNCRFNGKIQKPKFYEGHDRAVARAFSNICAETCVEAKGSFGGSASCVVKFNKDVKKNEGVLSCSCMKTSANNAARNVNSILDGKGGDMSDEAVKEMQDYLKDYLLKGPKRF